MEQLIKYYENMERLQNEGAPIDWQKVAGNMAQAIKGELASRSADPDVEVTAED